MLTEAYQIYDLHTTFPGNNGLRDWLSNSIIYALKLIWLLNILIVLLFLYISSLMSECSWNGNYSMPSDILGEGAVFFLNKNILSYLFSLEISFS